MSSRSYSNLLELVNDFPSALSRAGGSGSGRRSLPRVMTVPGILSEAGRGDDDDSSSAAGTVSSVSSSERIIIVANILPLHAERKKDGGGPGGSSDWVFRWDEDSLLLQLKDGLPEDMEVTYVGCLKAEVEPARQEEVGAYLLEKFNCVAAFLPADLHTRFYHGFCKQQLWPLFHYMLPLTPYLGQRFDRTLWQAYVSVNKIFADKVMEVIAPDDDYVWIHDYHLMVLPTFLRKRCNRLKLGFFLHSPFPSSEIYRTLPVREEILKALLNSDVVGFHTFDYARHFLSCCSRMLGLQYESKRGYIGLEYYGRTVTIKIMPVGIHMGQLRASLNLPETKACIDHLNISYHGKTVVLGVDDMDIFKGIGLKLLAMEQLLQQHPEARGKVVMVQIANPARGRGKDVAEVQTEVYSSVKRINRQFGGPGYQPIVLIDQPIPLSQRIAFYTIAECCAVTAVRDGMNLIPYEYIVCRQGGYLAPGNREPLKKSMLVVSEFIGCSPSLSGAIRVNPWNIDAVAEALNMAISMAETEKQMRHEKHYRYVSTHDVAYWSQSFIGDLERTCRDHLKQRCWGIGFGLGFRVVTLDPNFRKLSPEHIVSAYKRTSSRAIIVDYDGTMTTQSSLNKIPSPQVIRMLNTLCRDPKNVVFLVSCRGRQILGEWFDSCDHLGIAAEHGYFFRSNGKADWETMIAGADLDWKEIAEPIMKPYTESTDGSFIESKESAVVWHYQYADPDFGASQAKELLNHLESVLANEPVTVKRAQHTVEVKPQGVNKGLIADRLLSVMTERGTPPDFVLCIGDDRSDEDMFERIAATMAEPPHNPTAEVFLCTVGNKPSKAKYYVDDPVDVIKMLQGLATASESAAARNTNRVTFDSSPM